MEWVLRPLKLATVLGFSICLALHSSRAIAGPVLEAYYRAHIMHNFEGGLDTGSAYVDDVGLKFAADAGSLFGADSASVFVYLLHNNSTTFSDRFVGDLQVVSNIDAQGGTRLYEIWYEQNWSENHSLRFGLYDLNSEFDVIETAGLFMHSSQGIGAEYALSGEAGPSIFPLTSLTARYLWSINESATLRLAVLDGLPGDPRDASKTKIDLSSDDGILTALEFNYVLPGGARLGVGGWLYSTDFDLLDVADPAGNARRDNGNGGVYGFVDTPLLTSDSGLKVNAFLRYGMANEDINPVGSYLGAGIVASGVLQSRPDDQFGIGIASAHAGSPYKRLVAAEGGRAESAETSIEFTYSAQVNDWLRLQPNIQVVINPGIDSTIANALVFGLQFELAAGYEWN